MVEESVASRVAQRLLDDARAELVRADDKASSALSAVGALVAVAPRWTADVQRCRRLGLGRWAVDLRAGDRPTDARRVTQVHTGSRQEVLAYFGDVSRIRHERDLGHLLAKLVENPDEAVLSELRAVSKIVLAKYRYMRFGILCVVAGCALLVLSTS